jgi:hypothetical protein
VQFDQIDQNGLEVGGELLGSLHRVPLARGRKTAWKLAPLARCVRPITVSFQE